MGIWVRGILLLSAGAVLIWLGLGQLSGLLAPGADTNLLTGLAALIPLVPGAVLLGSGVTLLRGSRGGARSVSVPRRRKAKLALPEPAVAVVLPFRRPQKTVEGEWLH